MKDELFKPSAVKSLSPKLSWLKKHRLCTSCGDGVELSQTWLCSRLPAPGKHAVVLGPKDSGTGWTEEEAILDFCAKSGTKHWTLEAGGEELV
jgi:hypothetical protein